jgi:hypothetical protein
MKRTQFLTVAAVACLSLAAAARAQMGIDLFKKPGIASVFNPVVGHGGLYEEQSGDSGKTNNEISVVGKESVNGKDAFWIAFARPEKEEGMVYGKMLVTKDDFQWHRMIVQRGSQQPIEMPVNPTARTKQHMENEMEQWHVAGNETVTVPAGTFSCQHWQKNDGKGDVWTSDKVSPFGIVKEVSPGRSMILIKVITDAKDHITDTPKKFDPAEMRRQMMEQMQKQQKP